MLADRLADALYVDAMIIADDARGYFDAPDLGVQTPLERVTFSCESLKVTTRLMHVIAWLLTRRAAAAGDVRLTEQQPAPGPAVVSDPAVVAALPPRAREIVEASIDLFRRAETLAQRGDTTDESPARMLVARLAAAL